MCGIAGIWAKDGLRTRNDRAAGDSQRAVDGLVHDGRTADWVRDVRAMLRAIAHRGPDGADLVVTGAGVLGACRLAIIDPEHGAQPMTTADGRFTLAHNGAIVNFAELSRELAAEGATFRTRCDTEVLLEGLARKGPEFLARTNGMFGAVLFDGDRGSALLARDPCGIKPLYWLDEGDRVLFASEVKAILAAARTRPRPCREAILDYLAFQTPLTDRTFFDGVRRLLPGTMLLLSRGSPPEFRSLPAWHAAPVPRSADLAGEALRALLADAVRDHLCADVPVGAHLSGGVDSSYVSAIAARHIGPGMLAFTGAFDVPGFDERVHARGVAAEIGATVIESVPSPQDLFDALPAAVRAMDEPMAGPGLLPQWFVARDASRRVKVVLGGQGGDELFSGYVRHLILRLESALGSALRGGDTRVLRDLAPHMSSLDGYEPLLRRHFASGLFDPVAERYFSLVHRGGGLERVLAGDLAQDLARHPARERFLAAFDSAVGGGESDESGGSRADPVGRATRFDRSTLLPALLHVEDRTSMAWSVESRVPLLDRRVLAFVDGASDAVLFGDGGLKHLFRRAVRDDLPRSARDRRDKMGFPVPLAQWARGPLHGQLRDLLVGGVLRGSGFVDEGAIPRLLAGETVEARHLWALINLELWHREFAS